MSEPQLLQLLSYSDEGYCQLASIIAAKLYRAGLFPVLREVFPWEYRRRLPMRLIVTTTTCAGCRSFELQFLSVKYRRVLITIGFPSIIVKCSAFQLERVSLDTASLRHLQTCICGYRHITCLCHRDRVGHIILRDTTFD